MKKIVFATVIALGATSMLSCVKQHNLKLMASYAKQISIGTDKADVGSTMFKSKADIGQADGGAY